MPAAPHTRVAKELSAQRGSADGRFDPALSIDSIRHRVAPSKQTPGALESVGRLYRARFTDASIDLSLRRALSPRELQDFTLQWRTRMGVRKATSVRGVQDGEYETPPVESIPFEVSPVFSLSVTGAGTEALTPSPGPWRGEFNRALREIAPGLTERVTVLESGAEWDFVLGASLPTGEDLRIEAEVRATGPAERAGAGEVRQRTGDSEAFWRWPAGDGRSVLMGEMIVKDAQGYSIYRSLPELTSTGVRLVVPAAVLEGAALPVTIDPVVSVEYPSSDPVVGLPAMGDQDAPAVSWSGANYLVVWQDRRSSSGTDIWGARVSSTGLVQDPAGILISSAASDQVLPAVAWSGTSWLVVWQDSRNGNGSDIYGARVSASGTVLDPAGVEISNATDEQRAPALAWSGTSYLVVWQDLRSGNDDDIFGARVTDLGVVIDSGGLAISTATDNQRKPSISWDGTNFLVVWQDFRSQSTWDIYGARVSAAGTLLDATGFAVSTAANEQMAPDVDFDGTQHLVVWQDSRSGANDIYGARVTPSAVVTDGTGIAISTATNAQIVPRVAFDGTNHLVAWQDRRSGTYDIYAARVSTAGVVQDAAGIPISTASGVQATPDLDWDGTNWFVAWGDGRSNDGDIFGARVSSAGTVADATGNLISTAANRQRRPSVAFDGTNYLVVWEDYRSGFESDIYGARVSQTGAILDTTGLPISTAADDQLAPAVAWGGTEYLVVWQDLRSGGSSDIYAARVTSAGSVVDPSGLAVSTAANDQTQPALAWDGTNFLIVWADFRNGNDNNIRGARVSLAGSVLDATGIAVSSATDEQRAPAVDWDGTNHFVVWQDFRNGNDDNIVGARVDGAGSLLDGGGIPISNATDEQILPSIDFDGTNHLVAWQDYRSLSSYDIYAARVSPAGTVLDATGVPVSTAANDQTRAAVTWDGWNHVVAWEDGRSGNNSDIYASRISSPGVVLPNDVTGLAVSTSSLDSSNPAIVMGVAGRSGVVYDRLVPGSPEGIQRALLRIDFECPFEGGGTRGPCLIVPGHATALGAGSLSPTFSWLKGGTTVVRVEFSASPTFAKPRVRNSRTYKPITTWVPNATKWAAIQRLAPPGTPIYWHVVGKNGSSTSKFPSGDVFSFTVGP